MHLPRRMAVGEIQLGEVIVVGLDVGTFGHREAHVGEDRGEFVDDLADRMDAPGVGRVIRGRQGDVDRFGDEPPLQRRALEHLAPRRHRLGDAILEAVDERTSVLALLRRHFAQRRQQRGDRALLAERGDPRGFECGFVVSRADEPQQFLFKRPDVRHAAVISP